MREALEAWDERLRQILVGAPVVPIGSRDKKARS
jgi:hypothetical protein